MSEAENEKGVSHEALLQSNDVYIIYSFEDVAFHWNVSGRVFRRFKDTGRESETVHFNRLFTDAQIGGRLATRQEYQRY